MSEIKVNKISPRSGTDVALGDSGDTFTIPSGADLTIASGATLTNSGTATGFAGIAWQSVETGATFTAVAGKGYPVNTTAQACTVTLPASASVGDQIVFTDYARNWSTYALTINPNSLNYQGNSSPNPVYDTAGESLHIVYMDATKGWVPLYDGAVALETPQSYAMDFLVIGGGASGGSSSNGGGGGAGGYRTSTQSLAAGVAITVTVGDGGATVLNSIGNAGSASSFSGTGLTTISSAGGGAGGYESGAAGDGGCGGGAGQNSTGGSGDTPDTTPDQGYDGGDGYNGGPSYGGGGGGGAGAVGVDATSAAGGAGGAGVASSITGASVPRGGGGGGGNQPGITAGAGGTGGGGAANSVSAGTATSGTVNTGGGGGTARQNGQSGAGGKGVVIISMLDAKYSGTTTGSPTVATDAGGTGKTVLTFTGTGSYTT